MPESAKISYNPRKYQLEILDTAFRENIIAFLPTGAGKTLVSVLLIKEYLRRIQLNIQNGARKQLVAFIAPTKVLVGQQRHYIEGNCDAVVRSYTGDTRSSDGRLMDTWNKNHWDREFEEVQVIVTVPEIMRQIMQQRFITPDQFDCIILDECHHASGNHPMGKVCDLLNASNHQCRVFGMTASPFAAKKGSMLDKISLLEMKTGCRVVAPVDSLDELRSTVPRPNYVYCCYKPRVTYRRLNDYFNSYEAFQSILSSQMTPFLFYSESGLVLLHSYYRVRHAYFLADALRVYFALQMSIDDAPEFQSIYALAPELFSQRGGVGYHALADTQQLLGQILSIMDDCGVLCALHAFNEAVRFNDKTEKYTSYSWIHDDTQYATGSGNRKDVSVMQSSDEADGLPMVDLSQLGTRCLEVASGPYADHLQSMMKDHSMIWCSLSDMFCVLCVALGEEVCRSVLSLIEAKIIATENDMEVDQTVPTSKTHTRSIQSIMSILRTVSNGDVPSVAIGDAESFCATSDPLYKEHVVQLRLALSFACDSIISVLPASILHQTVTPHSTLEYMSLDKMLVQSNAANDSNTEDLWTCPLVTDAVIACMREVLYRYPMTKNLYAKLKCILPEFCNEDNDFAVSEDAMSCDDNFSTTSGESNNVEEVSEGWAAIVFCRMRLAAYALSSMFDDVIKSLERDIDINFPLRSTFLVGACNESIQNNKLHEFKAGTTNVLFATDVAEEGLDVRVCKLVVNFHPPVTVKSFIQRRGRGRAVNSIMTSIIPCNTIGVKICEHLLLLQQQEEALERNVQQGLVSLISSQNDATNISINAENDDEFFTQQELDEYVYSVAATQAQADVQSAIQIVTYYCQHTPHDAYFCPDALYWMAADASGRSNYRCSLLLPQSTPPKVRCIIGEPASRKALAKGLAALQCVRQLHLAGELDDWLIPLTSKRRKTGRSHEKEVTNRANKRSKRHITEVDNDPNSSLGWDNICDENPDSIAKIAVKITPDIMVPKEFRREECNIMNQNADYGMRSNVRQELVCGGQDVDCALYFYVWKHANEDITLPYTCTKHIAEHASIEHIGIAFLEALPADVLNNEFDIVHHNVPSRVKLCFIGVRCVDSAELQLYQRFHTAVASWQLYSTNCPVSLADWIKSSNNAWYIFFPAGSCMDHVEYATAGFPKNWMDILSVEASKAQQLVCELASYRRYVNECGGVYPPYRMNYDQSCDNLFGKLFYRGPGELYIGYDSKERVQLDNVMITATSEAVGTLAPTSSTLTYAEYFQSKNRITIDELNILRSKPGHRLVPCFAMAGRLTLVQLLSPQNDKYDSTSTHPTLFLIPEHCSVIGDAMLFLSALMLPSLVWRLRSQLLAIEARAYIMNAQYFQKYQQLKMVSTVETAAAIEAPSLSLFLTALTPRMALEAMNSERLEFLGDSLLKYVTTWGVFSLYPTKQEGFLTKARGMVINNSYLATCASKLHLIQYLRAVSISTGRLLVRYPPPGYYSDRAMWNVNISKVGSKCDYVETSHGAPAQYSVVEVKVKAVADLMEAIIGCFYMHGGMDAGVAAIKALMLWPTLTNTNVSGKPIDENATTIEELPKVEIVAAAPPVIPEGYPSMLRRIACGEAQLSMGSKNRENMCVAQSLPYSVVDAIYSMFGYRFVNTVLLDEALTHCSVQFKPSNQRFEFLGDAVLDFAVVHLLCKKYPLATQGQLSNLRSRTTCNKRLSALGLRLGLQKHIQAMSTPLIAEFADIQLWQNATQQGCENGINDKVQIEYVEKYGAKNGLKAIADAVEAMFGAIFVDSCGSFEIICDIVSNLCIIVDDD